MEFDVLHNYHKENLYIDYCFQVVPFPLFEFQSKWIAGILSGQIPLESTDEMRADIEAFYSWLEASGIPKRYTHKMGADQVIAHLFEKHF